MVGEVVADRYELKHPVGTGGMSTVFCAHDTLLERDVALKILHQHFSEDEEYVDRFRREARSVAQLSHPNIVTVIDRGEQDGRQFIVFEFVDGDNLKDVVERRGPLPVRDVLELGLDVARGLAFAHAQGIVHRDVKPQNVLVTPDGRAKVTDFGIARSLDHVGRTETGTVLGTSHYIAPEQARGERVDAQTDVYSFGIVLFELLAGDVPYSGDNFLQVAMRHVNEPVPNVLERRPDCPLRLGALVERCMAKTPEERPESMAHVVAELEAVLAELDGKPGGEATMIVRGPVLKESRRRRTRSAPPAGRRFLPLLLSLVGLALLAAAVAAVALREDEGGAADTGGAVTVQAVSSHDPEGTGGEHDELVAAATDGDPASYWATERYADFSATKDGVGLVLDAGDAGAKTLTVTTDTPGFTAEIRTGDSPTDFPGTAAGSQTVQGRTTFQLAGAKRYLLVWITDLDGFARVNEVTVTG